MSKGYVVSTDRVIVRPSFDGATLEWMSTEKEEAIRRTKNTPFSLHDRGEYLYWDGQKRIMTGIVEDAEVFATVDEAESGAFIASALDPSLAGHLHVVEKNAAFHREKENIAERVRRKAEYERVQANRFRLGGGEGGGI